MERYKKYYHNVKHIQKTFERLLNVIEACKNKEQKLYLAQIALNYVTNNNTGYFTSSILETFYTNYAKTIDIDDYNIEYKPNTFLHVMTTGYQVGGHTRVVENWIKNALPNQIHSVVFLNKTSELKILEQNVKEKHGTCIHFDNNLSLEERALKLRKLALNYEYIVLHTHMDDPTATVAFGNEKFTRPVLFYNHASHIFWIGKAISDVILDILDKDPVTIINRGIKNPFKTGIPTELKPFEYISKQECRKKLNLPLDKKIIISSGSKDKFNPILNDNIFEIMEKIIDDNTYFYAIGPSLQDELWKNAHIKSKGHIVPLGYINYNEGYMDYITAADLYIDSIPMCGWTASMNAIQAKTPVLCYKTVLPQLDYLTKTRGLCKSKEELINKAKIILNDKKYAEQILNEQLIMLNEMQSIEAWNNKMEELLKIIPQTHKVKELSKETDYKKIDDLCVMDNFISNKNFIKRKSFKQIKYELKYLLYKYIIKNEEKQIKYLLRTL